MSQHPRHQGGPGTQTHGTCPHFTQTRLQYYLGQNNSIYHAGVQYIIGSMVSALEDNPARKFVCE